MWHCSVALSRTQIDVSDQLNQRNLALALFGSGTDSFEAIMTIDEDRLRTWEQWQPTALHAFGAPAQ
jgi:hypothetical protein